MSNTVKFGSLSSCNITHFFFLSFFTDCVTFASGIRWHLVKSFPDPPSFFTVTAQWVKYAMSRWTGCLYFQCFLPVSLHSVHKRKSCITNCRREACLFVLWSLWTRFPSNNLEDAHSASWDLVMVESHSILKTYHCVKILLQDYMKHMSETDINFRYKLINDMQNFLVHWYMRDGEEKGRERQGVRKRGGRREE